MVREELGLDPDTLGGSPYTAAVSIFLIFTTGALIPLLPLFFAAGTTAVVASVLTAAAGLYVIGALITLLTGRSAVYSGSRQLVFGLAASGVTTGLGRLIGTDVGG
jgi:VIT1/CCC1 family predicted Fe2+/Mn2+ transporter